MSVPQPSRPEFPIVPALVVSSLLGGLIALGLSSVWRIAFPGPLNQRPNAAASGVMMTTSGLAEVVEFLPPLTPQEQQIEQALEKLAECDFTDTPLADVVAYFAEYAQIKMVIDTEAFAYEGIALDTPVTRKLNDLRLRSILGLILEPLQLTAVPKHDVLLVTTQSKSSEQEFIRTYPVSDLCRSPTFEGLDFQSLMRLIEEETSGPWSNRDGEGGVITELPTSGSISVRQRYGVHREILELLRNLRIAQRTNLLAVSKEALKKWDEQRAAAAASLLKRPAAPAEFVEVITTESDAERRIEKALDKNVTISFQSVPLTEVAAFFAKELSINVVIDHEHLTEEGIAADAPVTMQLQQITARSALDLLLRPLQLDVIIQNEVLLVTTITNQGDRLVARTYPVSDLIGPNGDYVSLMTMIESETSGPWMNSSGPGSMTESPTSGSLVVRQTQNVHRQVLNLLRQQREAQQRMLPMKPGKASPNRR